jgi:hypothetical protein
LRTLSAIKIYIYHRVNNLYYQWAFWLDRITSAKSVNMDSVLSQTGVTDGNFHKLTGAALACTMLTGAAVAEEMQFFRIGTGGAGGTYFPIGGIIANAISNPPGSRACEDGGNCGVPGLVAIAQSTNASAHNVNAIQAG